MPALHIAARQREKARFGGRAGRTQDQRRSGGTENRGCLPQHSRGCDRNGAARYLNDSHHKDDETYGVAEADVVKKYWDESALLARRFNRPENHSEIVVLTGQGVDPTTIPQPVIVQPDTNFRKIVGTLFVAHLLAVPPFDPDKEFVSIPDPSIIAQTLKNARLFKVQGRSAEPIALEGQYLITRGSPFKADAIASLDGRLVVGIDEDGARYFKRLRCHDKLVVLESLNPDGLTAAEVLSIDGSHALPKITQALEVIGVLFELPEAQQASGAAITQNKGQLYGDNSFEKQSFMTTALATTATTNE